MDIESYFGVAYAALIGIFFLCGLLRSCDLWKPLGKDADELYPARRVVACFYFSVVLLLPCALHPRSNDAWLLARCFWILFIPVATALSCKRFFFGDRLHRRLRIVLVGCVPLAFVLVMSGVAFAGGSWLLPYKGIVMHSAGVLGALLTAYEIHVMLWLWHIRSGADALARSADRLFPRNFASGILLVSSTVLVLTWVEFLFGNMSTNAAFAGVIALVGLGILIVILHPQRVDKEEGWATVALTPDGDSCSADDEEYEGADCEYAGQEAERDDSNVKLPVEVIDRIEAQVRDAMERDCLFLEPDMSVAVLASRINVNVKYLNIVLRLRFGRFKAYLSALRMEYSRRYIEEHPDAKSEEVAIKCGFGSARSYFRAKNDYMKVAGNEPGLPKMGIG